MKEYNVMGGIIGALIGALCAGPLGAAVGAWLGSSFLPVFGADDESKRIDDGQEGGLTRKGVLLIFQCLGKLAKSDGHVSEDEAEFVRSIMREWKLDAETRRMLGAEFNKGRDSSDSFLSLVRALNWELSLAHASKAARFNIMQVFCALVMADHELHPEERRMLEEAGRALDAEEYVHSFFAGYQEQGGYGQSHASDESFADDELARSYALLGIAPTATDAEVKSAYRKKAKEVHPDIVEGSGLSASFIRMAKEKFQELGNAYDTIRRHRGMK